MKSRVLATLIVVAFGFVSGGVSAQSVDLQGPQLAEQETHTLPGATGAEESVAEVGGSSPDLRIPAV
jgi:hypothetical protein